MEYWEFLLQQEGDHNWLPLDTAQVEILEGRYRIMAHTSQTNIPVQVQISQLLLDRVPPKRRSLRRQGQTNDDGLMVVMPFTRLKAGTWDIHCAGSLSSVVPEPGQALAEGESELAWAYAIQLQVLPQGLGDEDEWFADDGLSPMPMAEPGEDRDVGWPQPQASAESALPLGITLDLQAVTEALDRMQAHRATAATTQSFLYNVALNHTALSGQEGQLMGLSGRVIGIVDGESSSDMTLVVRLADPQTAEVVALSSFSLPAPALPTSFSLTMTIPTDLSTRLLIGEVGLVSLSAGTVNVLALQQFTVTVDLSSLFDAIADQAESEAALNVDFSTTSDPTAPGFKAGDRPDPDSRDSGSRDAEAWANIDLPQGPPRAVPVITLPRSGFNLPPKIYYPSPHEVSAHRPTLPPLSPPKAKGRTVTPLEDSLSPVDPLSPVDSLPQTASLPTAPDPDSSTASPSPGGSDRSVTADSPTATPTAPQSPSSDLPRPTLNLPPLPLPSPSREPAADAAQFPAPTLDGVSKPGTKPKVPLLPSHEAMGFRDLKLEDRFWSRLNDLAVTIQQEARQNRSDQEMASPPPTPGEPVEAEVAPAPTPFRGEVVIYEDEDETLGGLTSEVAIATAPSPPAEEPDIIAPPVPLLCVPGCELLAGEPILLTLRVPFHPNRLYIKVWITDPQTRSLVDEPRQVMHLLPNGQGQLEGSLQLTVPLGCLEAQFEAISVDMLTQQESYKATVSRAIAPTGLAPPDLEDFDL